MLSLKLLVVFAWLTLVALISLLLLAREEKKKRPTSLSEEHRERRGQVWAYRCRLLFCARFFDRNLQMSGSSHATGDVFEAIATMLSNHFSAWDVVPSDIFAALMLVRAEQLQELSIPAPAPAFASESAPEPGRPS